jgi:hypothetical protein
LELAEEEEEEADNISLELICMNNPLKPWREG